MARFEIGRPSQDVRLRNWPVGRAAILKLMVSRLEESLDNSLASGVEQSTKRKVSSDVPIIIEFSVTPGFRQFEISFPLPPGLGGAGRGEVAHPDRQLLFYEIQHDTSTGFSSPTTIETPQNHILISGVAIGETRSFRARVVNTKFLASPWTATVTKTTAQAKILLTAISETRTRLVSPIGTWNTILTKQYTATGGAVCLNVQIALGAPQTNITGYNGGPGFVQFKWMRDDLAGAGPSEFGSRTLLSARPGSTSTTNGNAPMAFGSFISAFTRPGSATIRFSLQAKKLAGSRWNGGLGTGALVVSDPLIFTRNGQILEVLERF